MIEKYELVDEHDRHGIADKLRGPFCTIDDGRHTWFGGNFFGLKIAAKNEAALRNGMRHLADLIEPSEPSESPEWRDGFDEYASADDWYARHTDAELAERGLERERTCHDVSENDVEFLCSNCHAYTDAPTNPRVEIGYKSGPENNLNYCPYCGARITEVD